MVLPSPHMMMSPPPPMGTAAPSVPSQSAYANATASSPAAASGDVDKELLSLFMMASGDPPTPAQMAHAQQIAVHRAQHHQHQQQRQRQRQHQQQQQQALFASAFQGHQQQQQQALPSLTPPTMTQLNAPYYDRLRAPASSTTNDEDLKHSKRLARKAELARASRKRKKMYVSDLEEKVKRLSAKIEEMQAKQAKHSGKPKAGSSKEKERKESQNKIKAQLAEIVRMPVANVDMNAVESLISEFVGNSRERQARVGHYLDRVAECMSPGLQVKFALWGLDQSDDFYDKPGLWTSLLNAEIGLSPQQMQKLKGKREAIRAERQGLAKAELMLKHLREHATNHINNLNKKIDEIRSIFTPLQLARFYVWVEENEWCMQMLSSILQNQDKSES